MLRNEASHFFVMLRNEASLFSTLLCHAEERIISFFSASLSCWGTKNLFFSTRMKRILRIKTDFFYYFLALLCHAEERSISLFLPYSVMLRNEASLFLALFCHAEERSISFFLPYSVMLRNEASLFFALLFHADKRRILLHFNHKSFNP